MHARHHSRRAVLERAAIFAVPPALSLLPCSAAHAAAELTDEQSLIVEAWAVVQRGYVDQQFGGNDWKAIKSEYLKRKYKSMGAAREAIGEMLSVLGDRYTRYLSPGAYSALLAKYERPADNGGIGVTLRSASVPAAKLSQIEIVSIVPGGPAAAAGLQVGDLFETVDGRTLPTYATADDVAGLLLGRLEEPVSVSVRRADGSSASFNLRRAVLKQGEVEAREVVRPSSGKRIGVLTVPLFSAPIANGGDGGTLASLQAALSSEPLVSCQELLIDLRGNPGGHFPSGVEAAKLFLPADVTVVATVDRTGKPSPVLTFAKGPFAGQDRPTYVLVDKGTASAAEVFAAALQGNRAAKVVGERTYGKGLVQSIQRLTDSSAVVLTVAKYRTPQGEDINGKGIVPALPVACASKTDAVQCLEQALASRRASDDVGRTF
ncbi:c-terminal processing peptidase-2 [Chrysochromulina tobinii]|uniref:C-terminal processing peptidase-2 n=1 Tax=Chrysochromulina tobinii TaxID=1460289 RepID=A0A0M0JLK9_9EUKA|nr:c-terminal processing peptidase-2 [Chrysochromulina tobinii]|eukprot:KOO27380.1 c-terminal processing peptidase-2 [Chrysochromulina sp. CCMP291]